MSETKQSKTLEELTTELREKQREVRGLRRQAKETLMISVDGVEGKAAIEQNIQQLEKEIDEIIKDARDRFGVVLSED